MPVLPDGIENEWKKGFKDSILSEIKELEELVKSDLWSDIVNSDEAAEIAVLIHEALSILKAEPIDNAE